jgi:enoyl-CoA hydratase/carnithine racemase
MSLIRYDLDGGAARIILTAPDRGNPLDPDMAAELFRAVRRARADDARVVVLRSEGRAFSWRRAMGQPGDVRHEPKTAADRTGVPV